ncbi:hypothetical protein C8J56DRAFT_1048601 [Mycena floridula]|nr:hypothetical protein C8J56DRAFT_1048601 [Mycena floridula]
MNLGPGPEPGSQSEITQAMLTLILASIPMPEIIAMLTQLESLASQNSSESIPAWSTSPTTQSPPLLLNPTSQWSQPSVIPASERPVKSWAEHHYTCDMVRGFQHIDLIRENKKKLESGKTYFHAAFPEDKWVKQTFNKHYCIYNQVKGSKILLKYVGYGRMEKGLWRQCVLAARKSRTII